MTPARVLRALLDDRYPEGTTYVEDEAHGRVYALSPDGRTDAWELDFDAPRSGEGDVA
jgi:outer membrane protein assembly factor BamB